MNGTIKKPSFYSDFVKTMEKKTIKITMESADVFKQSFVIISTNGDPVVFVISSNGENYTVLGGQAGTPTLVKNGNVIEVTTSSFIYAWVQVFSTHPFTLSL